MTRLAVRTSQRKTTHHPSSHHESVKRTRSPISPLALRTPLVQPKLKVNPPGDRYKQEADDMANRVMRMPESQPQRPGEEEESLQTKSLASQITPLVQRQEEPEEETAQTLQRQESPEEETVQTLQRQEEAEETAQTLQRQEETEEGTAQTLQRQPDEGENVQTKAVSGHSPKVSPALATHIQSLRSGGQPLPSSTRNFFESRFGADFSGVRLHKDAGASSAANDLKAQAFTVGQDIFFGTGRYASDSTAGQRLLAHEFTHTIQQQPTTAVPSPPPALPAKAAPETPSESGLKVTETGTVVSLESKRETPSTAAPLTSTAAVPVPEKASGAIAVPKEGAKEAVPTEPSAAAPAVTAEPSAPRVPQDDPDFQAVVKQVKQVASQQQRHAPASTKAKEAQAAAVSPASERESQAQANQVDQMAQAQIPPFDAAAFKAALLKRIAEIAPKKLQDADEFKQSNKLASVKEAMTDKVKQEKGASQKPLAEKTQQKPDTSSIKPKPVTKLPPIATGKAPGSIGAGRATPKPQPASTVEAPLQKGSQQLDQQMAKAGLTDQQLAQSNEPTFQEALTAKQTTQKQAIAEPQAYRQFEQNQLSQAKVDARTSTKAQLQGMHGDRTKLLTQIMSKQEAAKGKDEQARAKIAEDIQKIYQTTKGKVEKILSDLDTQVSKTFDAGAEQAKKAFENYVDSKMKTYKAKRYGGSVGKLRWVKDKVLGLPSEVNAFYQEAKQYYLQQMDAVLDRTITLIATHLTEAKTEIARGRKEIQEYVGKLPSELQQVGRDAATQIQGQFQSLEQTVNSKQDALINTLAQKYQAKVKTVDDRIKKLKTTNEGLLTKAVNAVKGVVKTILKLKAMLTKVLAKVAHVVPFILAHPIRFLGNLIAGLKQGFLKFVGNIGKHLQAGLIGWLTGALGPTGIQIPKNLFSLAGIFSLVVQVLGLTWDYIRTKAVKLFGEPVVAAMEKAVAIFKILRKEGAKGLWKYVQKQFTDLKQQVIDQIKGLVITQVITAGVKWILSLLSPAGALVKAATAIYDIVMFFVDRGSQILQLVNSVVDAVAAIAKGAIGGAAKLVETTLVRILPLAIGFLASLLGLSGLAKKVEAIIGKIRKRVDRAIDKLLLKAKALWKRGKAIAKKGIRKLAYLLKIRKKLQLGKAKTHTILFRREGKQYRTYINPLYQKLQEWIERIRKWWRSKKNKKQEETATKAKDKTKQVDKEVASGKISKPEVEKSLEEIVKLMPKKKNEFPGWEKYKNIKEPEKKEIPIDLLHKSHKPWLC